MKSDTLDTFKAVTNSLQNILVLRDNTFMASPRLKPTVMQSSLSTLDVMWEFDTSLITNATPPSGVDSPKQLLMSSDTFMTGRGTNKKALWKIVVDPSYFENGIRYISVYFRLMRLIGAQKYIETTFQLSLLHPHKQWLGLISQEDFKGRKMSMTDHTFGWKKFMTYTQLGRDPHPTMRFNFILQTCTDPMSLRNHASMFGNTGQSSVTITEIENAPQQSPRKDLTVKDTFQLAFKILWKKKNTEGWIQTDCLLLTEDRHAAVHCKPLAMHSPKIFQMILESGFIPSTEEPFNLVCHEWPEEAIEAILEFCYTGELTKWIPDTWTLFKLAEATAFFQIEGLSQQSRKMILLRTNAHNYDYVYDAVQMINQVEMDNMLPNADMRRMEYLLNYNKSDFLLELLSLRAEFPSILSDYKENIYEYSEKIFSDLPVCGWDEDSDGDIPMID